MLALAYRRDLWQVGYVIVKGSYAEVRRAGLEALRREIVKLVPELAERMENVTDWKRISVLSLQVGHAVRWHRPGFLLIGDAAHIMSPIGGVGINHALMDAVAAADLLTVVVRRVVLVLRLRCDRQHWWACPTRSRQSCFGNRRIRALGSRPRRWVGDRSG